MIETNETTFKVLRFDPDKDKEPYFKEYKFKPQKGMTILDGLMYIKENMDSSLSYRKSCRMGVCGSCAMFVNEKPVLACQTQISELQSSIIEVRPLPNYPIIRDVVPDLTPLFEKHENIKPYIIRKDTEEMNNPSGEYLQTPSQLDEYIQFSYCIKCGCCVSACPTSATYNKYLGPQALAQSYRYIIDSRDDGFKERQDVIDTPHGLWKCHFPGACSDACPKGVDPAFAIQLLKREVVFREHKLIKGHKPAPLETKPTEGMAQKDIPTAPPFTAR